MPSSPPLPPPRLVITWTQPDPAILDILTASLTPGGPYNLTFTPVPNYYASPIVPKAQLTPYTSGTINRADLTGLPPASTLYYVVSSDGGAVTTPERAVKTHPGVGPDVPITMTLLADWDFECFDGKVCEPAAVLNHVIRADVWEGVNAGAIIAGEGERGRDHRGRPRVRKRESIALGRVAAVCGAVQLHHAVYGQRGQSWHVGWGHPFSPHHDSKQPSPPIPPTRPPQR